MLPPDAQFTLETTPKATIGDFKACFFIVQHEFFRIRIRLPHDKQWPQRASDE